MELLHTMESFVEALEKSGAEIIFRREQVCLDGSPDSKEMFVFKDIRYVNRIGYISITPVIKSILADNWKEFIEYVEERENR